MHVLHGPFPSQKHIALWLLVKHIETGAEDCGMICQFLIFLCFLNILDISTCQRYPTTLSSTCSNRLISSSISPCVETLCMEIWSEKMPLTWIETSRYIYHSNQRVGPRWNIFDDINCLVKQKIEYNSAPFVCSCNLPKMTSRSTYADFSLTHSTFYGDSTLRNFVTYMWSELDQVAYMSLIHDRSYHAVYKLANDVLFPSQPDAQLVNFTSRILDYHTLLKRLPRAIPFWTKSKFTTNQCLNLSRLSSSVITYRDDAYEDLDESHVHYYSDSIEYCNSNPDRLLIFVVSGGLHYLTVRSS